MSLFRLAFLSIKSRGLTVGLTILAIALSVMLFVGVEKLRTGAKASFAGTISDTDLILGARTGSVQLLLYSVFRIGNATNNVTWESFRDIASRPEVSWAVPISLGDSHRQFRVMGTTAEFFLRYQFRGGQSLAFQQGAAMSDLFEAVVGADVAEQLGYDVGDPIVVAHGLASFSDHDDTPFKISGILEKTGTPVDRTVIVSLEAIEAIHVDWQSGAQKPGAPTPVERIREMDLRPKAITAAMIGVESPLQIFKLQRAINEYPQEPLLAVLPGVALQELWGIVGIAETALVGVSAMVVVTALIGMSVMILSGLSARRREMAILRAMGAGPWAVVSLLMIEAILMSGIGSAIGMALLYVGLAAAQPWLDYSYGLHIPIDALTAREGVMLAAVLTASALVSVLPAIRAYRMSLADGMMVKM